MYQPFTSHTYLLSKRLEVLVKIGLAVLSAPIIVLLPTQYLFPGVDLTTCVISEDPLLNSFLSPMALRYSSVSHSLHKFLGYSHTTYAEIEISLLPPDSSFLTVFLPATLSEV